MFLTGFCGVLLVATSVLSSSQFLTLDNASILVLTELQSDHYLYIKNSLDAIDLKTSELYFVDDDLKSNAEQYFNNLAYEELEQLAPLKEGCGQNDSCLACFDSETEISKVSLQITAALVEHFEKQKEEFNKTIADIKSTLQDSALLSTAVYEKYKDSSDFETNARAYYEQIHKAVVYERDLFKKTVETTISQLVKYKIDATIQASDQMEEVFNTIVGCVDEALNH